MSTRIDLSVADVAALSNIHVSDFRDGDNAWVNAEGNFFVLNRQSGVTPDVNNIQPAPGSPRAGLDNARWVRSGVSPSQVVVWLNQPTWYINPTTGNDANDGTQATQGAGNVGPLKTLTQFFSRVSYPNIINVAMTIIVNGNIPAADDVRSSVSFGPAGSLYFVGNAATTLYSGTVTARTLLTRSTNTPAAITDSSFPAGYGTTFIQRGVRFRLTNGNANAQFWALKDLTANQLRISNPNIPIPALGIFGQSETTIAVGNTFVVEQLNSIDSIGIEILGNVDSTTPAIVFQGFTFTNRPQMSAPSMVQAVAYFGCDVGAIRSSPGAAAFVNCRFTSGISVIPGAAVTILFGACLGTMSAFQGSNILIDQGFMVQGGAGLDLFCGGNIGDMGVFDSSTDGITCEIGMNVIWALLLSTFSVWGSGNTGAGFRTRGGAVISMSAIAAGLTITGASDTKINTTAKSWVQVGTGPGLIVSDIAAGAGTAISGIVIR